MIPIADIEHQRCEDTPAQANGLGFRFNAKSPERAPQRERTRSCPALSGLTALLGNFPKAMPWAGLFSAFGPAITTIESLGTSARACGVQAALPSRTNPARRIGVWIVAMMGIGLLCSNAPKASAAAVVFTFDNINRSIPDDSPLGLSDPRDVSTPFTMILKVSISLTISGDFNGDLYVQVTHGSGFSVLLNRLGRTALNEFGYGDAGMDITLSDHAAAGDVHVYRTTLFGNENTPVAGMLTGVWAPDARITDPDAVLNTDARSATLSSFNGLDPNGTWTLFIADASGGGQSTLKSWSVNAEVVPEPNAVALLVVGSWLLCLLRCQRRWVGAVEA